MGRVLSILFLLALGAGLGFIVGIGQAHFPIVQKVTHQIENVQTELSLLRTELAKKAGIVIPQAQTADITLNKAQSFIQQGQLANAALYFNNAWANQPTWQTLQRYQQSVLQYCRQLIEKADLNTALQLLNDMDNFLRSQTSHLTVAEIEQLQQMLDEVSQLKQSTETLLAEKQAKPQEVEKAQAQEAIATLSKRVEYFLTQASDISAGSELPFYYLTSAQSILQQLILQASEIDTVKTTVAKLSEDFEKTKQVVLYNQSKLEWEKISKGSDEITIAEVGKAEDILQQWLKRRQFLMERVSKLVSPEFSKMAQESMDKINSEITNWQTEQQRRYERWAIGQIESFYNSFKEHGKNTDPYSLGEIDTRYLSAATNAAYNEVFSTYYAKLESGQKITVSSQMFATKKQKLSRF